MAVRVTVYSRPECHLCDVMKAELREAGADVEEINVDSDRELKRLYGWDIPVAVVDGEVIAKHRLDSNAREALRRHAEAPESGARNRG